MSTTAGWFHTYLKLVQSLGGRGQQCPQILVGKQEEGSGVDFLQWAEPRLLVPRS